ncbi:MAG: hypothetical protein EPO28_07420 [Saprospiraceae bacterium]|nr:MAG: hypothetical protein EPO28_07420 [Saprospiraceae bacterium]
MDAQVSINNLATETNSFLCQPGVTNKTPGKGASISYDFNPDFQMRPPGAERSSEVRRNERFKAKLKVPIVNSKKFKAMLGFHYSIERYHFDKIDPEYNPLFKRLNDTALKSAGMAAYFVVPINEKYYTSFRLSASWLGDYKGFISLDSRYGVYRAAGLFGVKQRDDLEYGIGLLYTKSFVNTSLIPFGFYNRTFDKHWGVEMAIPVSLKGRYNFKEGRMMLFGTEYSSQNYAMNVAKPVSNPFLKPVERAPFHYHRSSLDLTASYCHQLSGWTWVELKTGYAFSLKSKAKDLPENKSYDLKPSGSMVGMVTVFLSPPKYLITK